MARSSSLNLHPAHGGRFVLVADPEREGVYRATIYLPDARYETSLSLGGEEVILDPEVDEPWARTELLKLARVLKKNPRPALTRWRGRS